MRKVKFLITHEENESGMFQYEVSDDYNGERTFSNGFDTLEEAEQNVDELYAINSMKIENLIKRESRISGLILFLVIVVIGLTTLAL
tara:strand:+ start:49 stop:309 length:261 start_codon:yes stop_codon:yes gene_type:complete